MSRPKKADLVAKIAKEQNLDPEKLGRMSIPELQKMDIVVPDEGEKPEVQQVEQTPKIQEPKKVAEKAPLKTKFKNETPEERLLRKTPGKYRKFLHKGRV